MKEMNPANKRGKDFEMRLAKLIRQKLHIKTKRDSRSGGGTLYKSDLAGFSIPGQAFHVEAKSQAAIRLPEWWQQTTEHSGYKTPVLVVDMGGYDDLAIMRLDDFLNLCKTIADDMKTITELRSQNELKLTEVRNAAKN